MIGYDFNRTLIKYDDATPYQIRTIGILKAGETYSITEKNQLFTYFKLPIFWDDTLNLYGYVKGNRGVSKLTWYAEPTAPSNFATSLSGTDVVITWGDNSNNETGFSIERSLTNESSYAEVHTTAAGVKTWTNTGLNLGSTYYFRARAFTSTGYSSYSASDYEAIPNTVDYDGNVYTSVVIGTQTWLVENLKTTHYNDGTAIANITNAATWAADVTGAYRWYADNIANKTPYGALYNYYAAVNAKGVCPSGYHVSTYSELQTLYTYLGGTTLAGGAMKETGETHWTSNTGATNSSGFTSVGAGRITSAGGSGEYFKTYNWIWGTPQFDATGAYFIRMAAANDDIYTSHDSKAYGYNIRCIKD
jgi:uncharacterized protein (TIGR02145 family)